LKNELVEFELELLPLLKNELPAELELLALDPLLKKLLDDPELPDPELISLTRSWKESPVGSTNCTGSFPQ